jgi:glycosyltransferase involved in cell wall biosynthesis
MPRFYVCNTRSRSGIARYSESFFRVALQGAGYVHLQPDEVGREMARHGAQSGTVWHIELGAHQYLERDAYVRLVRAGHEIVDVTLHEPPFITFPFFSFKSRIANRVSRGVDWYLDTLGWQSRYLRKARRIFVLSERGAAWLRERRGISRVQVLPHVIEAESIWSGGAGDEARDILFFGFVGRAKGLDYALALHSAIRKCFPDVEMHVVGQSTAPRDQRFLNELKRRFADGVRFHGFVPEAELEDIFARCTDVFLPFAPYKYFCPVSGSIIHGIKRGRVVWTSNVNAVRETITPGVNGLIFDGSVERDLAVYQELRASAGRRAAIASSAIETARSISRFDYGEYFDPTGRPSS